MNVSNLNRTVLSGRLLDDAVLTELPSGYPLCNFELEVQRPRQDPDSGAWVQAAASFEVVVCGNLAESIAPYLRRGRQVAVDGWLDVHQRDDRRDGVHVVADAVLLLGSPPGRLGRPAGCALEPSKRLERSIS
jgi:single-strand DNA-binding protein